MSESYQSLARKLGECYASLQKMSKRLDWMQIPASERAEFDQALKTAHELHRLAVIKARENAHAVVTAEDLRRMRIPSRQ
jgi:hypothetical protein